MAKFVLLLFLVVAVGSSIAWPNYSHDTEQDRVSAERERENRHHPIAESSYDNEAEVDTYDDDDEDADTANEDTAIDGYHQYDAINQLWRRKRKHKRRSICKCKLEVYSEENFGGKMFTVRDQNSNLQTMFNDEGDFIPMSFKVKGHCQWILYGDVNFAGRSHILEPGDHPIAHTWSAFGRVSYYTVCSARVLPPKGSKAFVIFRWPDYTGRMVTIYNSKRDLSKYFSGYFNSFIVTGGKWKLYTDTKYKGDKESYSGKQMVEYIESDSGSLFVHNKLKSIKRKK